MQELQQHRMAWVEHLLKNTKDMDAVCDLMPGIVHLSHLQTLQMVYLDRRTRHLLGLGIQDILEKGKEMLLQYAEPECYNQAQEMYREVATLEDLTQVVSCFQAFRVQHPSNYEWYFTSTKRFSKDLIISISTPLRTLGNIHNQVERVLNENLYIRKNLRRFNTLTPREKEIMQRISKGESSNHIAESLFISPHTVSTHRKNIWRKLEINSYAELIKLAEYFNIL